MAQLFYYFNEIMLNFVFLIIFFFSNVKILNGDTSTLDSQIFATFDSYRLVLSTFPKKSLKKPKETNLNMSKIVVTKPLTLQIWENNPQFPAPGTRLNLNLPVGFASLSFTLENKTQNSILIKFISIEVHSVDNKIILMSMPAQNITIHPLEISPQRYQLSNKNGYGNINQVEAVVIYELEGQQYTLKSSPVKISL